LFNFEAPCGPTSYYNILLFFGVIEVIEVNGVNDISSAADIARQSIVDNFERSDNFVNFFNFHLFLSLLVRLSAEKLFKILSKIVQNYFVLNEEPPAL